MTLAKDKRQMILDIATRIFLRYGYAKTSLDEIASEAKIAKGTIYYYFSSKDELFVNVVSEQSKELINDIEQKLNTKQGFEEKLRFFLHAPVEYVCDKMPIWIDGIKNIPFHYKEYFEKYREANRAKMLEMLQGIIDEGIKEDMISDVIIPDRLCEIINDWFLLGDLSVMVVDFEGLLHRVNRDRELITNLILYGILKRG